MRALLLAALAALAGCQVILGIDDPKPAGADDDDDDVAIDASPIDGPPIDTPPPACDIFDPDACGAGMACDYIADTSTIDCRASAGAGALGACTTAPECGPVSTCQAGACRTYCNVDGDCTSAQNHCHDFQHPSGVKICDSMCDWTANDDGGCGAGYLCKLGQVGDGTGTDAAAICVPGTPGTVSAGGECTAHEDCVGGTACTSDGVDPVNRCYQFCKANAPNCTAPQVCEPLGNGGSEPLVIHGDTFGICFNPQS
jgi:hypothetical protein